MKVGISTACFFNRMPVEESLLRIASFGVPTTECFFASCCEYAPPLLDAIAVSAKKLEIHSVHAMCTQFEPQLFALNQRQRADADRMFDEFLHAAKRICTPNYTFHGPLKLKRKASFDHDYDRLGETMNSICARAAAYGVTVCYENVHYSNANDPEYLRQILSRCPSLCAVLDVKQAAQADIPYADYLAVMGDRIRTVHVCDMRGTSTCLPGQGDIDFVRLFSDLSDARFDGAVLLEAYPGDYRGYDELLKSYDYLLECREKAR